MAAPAPAVDVAVVSGAVLLTLVLPWPFMILVWLGAVAVVGRRW